MRYGKNPLKREKVEPPSDIAVGVLTCIPSRVGYFRGVFDCLKLCLASIRHHADRPFDLLVVDNGSIPEVKDYLLSELAAGHVDYLTLNTRNVGKANAMFQILRSAPGDLIFYTDGDIFFKEGWMQAHLEIMETFPDVGMVSGIPLRNQAEFYTAGTRRWVEANSDNLSCEKGDLIPEEWTIEFVKSLERMDPRGFLERWAALEDWRIEHNGVHAYVGASHMQYLTSRQVIDQMTPQRFAHALHTEDDQYFDRAIEEAELLRLSVDRPYVHHIGNTLSEDWQVEAFEKLVGEKTVQMKRSRAGRKRHWLWGRSKVRRVFQWLYEWAFNMYHKSV
jgi:glycosyltransferase involved in cell wall biosynthesis